MKKPIKSNPSEWPPHIRQFYKESIARFKKFGWSEQQAEAEARSWAKDKLEKEQAALVIFR